METLDEYCKKIEAKNAKKESRNKLFAKLINYWRKR